jgi:hypothetical protein
MRRTPILTDCRLLRQTRGCWGPILTRILTGSFLTLNLNIDSLYQLDWLIGYLRFYVPLKNFSLIWRRHHSRWRAAIFRPMLGAQGLWAGRDLYRATPAVTRDLGFSGLIWRTAPFSRLLRHTRGCGGSILTRILTGVYQLETVGFIPVTVLLHFHDRYFIYNIQHAYWYLEWYLSAIILNTQHFF